MLSTIINLIFGILLGLSGALLFGFAMKRNPEIAFGFFHNIMAGVVAAIIVTLYLKFKDTR